VVDFTDVHRWRWLLRSAGSVVAEHEVRLDPDDEWECEAFEDFYGYLSTLAARDRRAESEGSLVHQVGQWVTDRVLGPLGPLIAAQPGVVRLRIPRAAAELAHLPWQIAVIDGQPPAALRVTLVTELGEQAAAHESEEGGQLRILALFSLPDGASALDLRQERQDLVRLVRDIVRSTGSDIKLQVLQYGATRSRLRAALSEADGWNVVHISSHGLPSGLWLEDDAGRPDLVSGSELSELLGTTRHKADLVVLSSCESAADARADGDADEEPRHGESTSAEGSRPAPAPAIGSLATHLVDRLDCAVLAMRFPVTDVFARRISTAFYGEVLRERRAVADALGVALRTVGTDELDEAISLLSICTPALFGRRAVDLRLVAPPKEPTSPVERSDLDHPAGWKPLPDHFVGRVSLMTRARRALEVRSDQVGVALHGMAGVGKTACALELAYTDGEAFQLVVCYQAPGKSVGHKGALINALETIDKRTGARLIDMIDNPSSLAYSVREMTRRMRALFVLDGLDTVLDDRGEWPSEG
jgi:CHAT domain